MGKATWDKEKKELLNKLGQAEGHVQQLQGQAEICDCELFELRTEVRMAPEACNKVDIMWKFLELERDSVVSAREGYESKVVCLNSELLIQEKELERSGEKLSVS